VPDGHARPDAATIPFHTWPSAVDWSTRVANTTCRTDLLRRSLTSPKLSGRVDQVWLRQRADAIDSNNYQGDLSGEDFEYTCYWFGRARLCQRVARAKRAVIFTVDQ